MSRGARLGLGETWASSIHSARSRIVNGNDTVRESTLWALVMVGESLVLRGLGVKVSVKEWIGGGGGGVAGVRA